MRGFLFPFTKLLKIDTAASKMKYLVDKYAQYVLLGIFELKICTLKGKTVNWNIIIKIIDSILFPVISEMPP